MCNKKYFIVAERKGSSHTKTFRFYVWFIPASRWNKYNIQISAVPRRLSYERAIRECSMAMNTHSKKYMFYIVGVGE